MTKAKLTVWIDWDSDKTGVGADLPGPESYTVDIDVQRDDQSVTIEITPDQIRMHTLHEPHRAIMVPGFYSDRDESQGGEFPDLSFKWDTRQEEY